MNGGMTILLVDDEQTQRNILAGYLRKKGYTVLEAGTL
jgi:DNA-binding response OmpR family regulator